MRYNLASAVALSCFPPLPEAEQVSPGSARHPLLTEDSAPVCPRHIVLALAQVSLPSGWEFAV
jgi:hypothetical protein